jgi:hypothetical protein
MYCSLEQDKLNILEYQKIPFERLANKVAATT